MKIKNFKLTNNKRLLSMVLAGFMLFSQPSAKANTEDANKELDKRGIVYAQDDSIATNLIVNASDVLKETKKNGSIPAEYSDMLLDPTLVLGDLNTMRENILNYNAVSLFNDPSTFNYLSMGIYLDSEVEKNILSQVAELVNKFCLNPSDIDTLDRLVDIFRGNDKDISIYLLNVGGLQALANDVYFLNAIVQAYELEDYYQTFYDLMMSYGDNANIITYIKAIDGIECKTKQGD